MDMLAPIRQDLQSYPGSMLTLPAGSQLLIPGSRRSQPLKRAELVARIEARVLQSQAAVACLQAGAPCRLLLLLPDKTRRQNAAHLAIDALLSLCEHHPLISLTLLYGLGTHPRMAAEDLSRLLGRDREQRLQRCGATIHQQTTLAPLPCRALEVAQPTMHPQDADQTATGTVTLQMPDMLWDCDLLLVAGDTDLHPYEGRAGSGGIHKMLAIGVGCLTTIRITHSLEILTDPLTRPGETGNRFVKLVDHFAAAIIQALMAPQGRLLDAPIGVSVVADRHHQLEAFWIGDQEAQRAILMQPLAQERTRVMNAAVTMVVADTEQEKGTDLLAGARSLHFLCNFNDRNNPILCRTAPVHTALLFNACHERRNAHGIGNTGTVLHLQALHQFSQEAIENERLSGPDGRRLQMLPWPEQLRHRQRLKGQILNRWERYLHLVSEEDRLFAALDRALLELDQTRTPQTTAHDGAQPGVLRLLERALPHSFGAHRHVLTGTRQRLLQSGPAAALAFLRQASEELGFKGLGEGGQRALRLLAILRTFTQLQVATDNPVVLDFLDGFQASAAAEETDTAAGGGLFGQRSVIGLEGISLIEHSPQEALELSLHRHRSLLQRMGHPSADGAATGVQLAFLQQPVILRQGLNTHPGIGP